MNKIGLYYNIHNFALLRIDTIHITKIVFYCIIVILAPTTKSLTSIVRSVWILALALVLLPVQY